MHGTSCPLTPYLRTGRNDCRYLRKFCTRTRIYDLKGLPAPPRRALWTSSYSRIAHHPNGSLLTSFNGVTPQSLTITNPSPAKRCSSPFNQLLLAPQSLFHQACIGDHGIYLQRGRYAMVLPVQSKSSKARVTLAQSGLRRILCTLFSSRIHKRSWVDSTTYTGICIGA